MSLSIVQGFTKSLAMTVLSEIGDKTFFAAAILAMRHPRRYVLAGCLSALIVMTVLSAAVGWAAPNLDDDDTKKKSRPFFSQFFSPIFLKAFSITFFGEWGDKSQLATIGLAAAENPLGVVLGGILLQYLVEFCSSSLGSSHSLQLLDNDLWYTDNDDRNGVSVKGHIVLKSSKLYSIVLPSVLFQNRNPHCL
ncbi:hypothetical protein CTI12_AA600220 [Artemisia annua]|uniref:GDT1 family protein n=1 Tax=Artemisia annua TaxID=35608 RepID=A0A2U1KI16_ARTAN|nr:hypothetical protein CTI12_AA600220 [Artemisia annua]